MKSLSRRIGPVLLAVLVVAGQIKANPLLAWVPVDLTLVVGALVGLCIIACMIYDGAPRRTSAAPFVVWMALLPAIALTQTWDGYAQTKVVTLFTVTFLLAVSPFFLMRHEGQRKHFLVATVVVALIALSDAVLFGDPVVEGRLEFEGANTIGSARVAMAGAVILILAAIGPGTKARWRLPFGLLGIGAAAAALQTGSRGPVIAAGVALVAVALVAPALRRYRGRMILGLAAAVAVAAWLARDSIGLDRILSVLDENGTSQNSRRGLLDLAGAMIQAEPLGTGWGSFTAQAGYFRYPHNLIFELGVEAGIVVMAVVILGLLATVIRAGHNARDLISLTMFALLVFAIFNAMVSGDINASRLMVVVVFSTWAMPRAITAPAVSPETEAPTTRSRRALAQRTPIRSR